MTRLKECPGCGLRIGQKVRFRYRETTTYVDGVGTVSFMDRKEVDTGAGRVRLVSILPEKRSIYPYVMACMCRQFPGEGLKPACAQLELFGGVP